MSPEEFAGTFLNRAAAQLGSLRDRCGTLPQIADEAERQDALAEIYLGLHSFTPETNLPTVHPAMQLSAAIEGLLKKLLEDPQNSTPSTLVSVATGVELLHELCGSGTTPDVATTPPIRMLVVDDDPVSRRAVVCALQMAFEKPDSVGSGMAALALASEKTFDVIFLDVQMPGMDGFEVCSKIRERGMNRATPVVFVTGQSDFESRAKMNDTGGNDFVAKPFLNAEITVKALTFALRGKIQKLKSEACDATATPIMGVQTIPPMEAETTSKPG